MKRTILNVGDKFNKLSFIEVVSNHTIGSNAGRFGCECGGEIVARIAEVKSGHTRSCGCATWKVKSRERSKDIVGKKFSRLTVDSLAGTDNRKYRLCNCTCECGNKPKIRIARLLSGEAQSCGCLQLEKAMENLAKAHKNQTIHGYSDTLTGRSWNCMMQRCFNPWSEGFHRYGGVGITACAFFKASPINLVLSIGERSRAGLWLDRINNEGGYWCGGCEECLSQQHQLNVRWATPTEQALNRSNTVFVEIDGVIKKAAEWREILGLPRNSKDIYKFVDKND